MKTSIRIILILIVITILFFGAKATFTGKAISINSENINEINMVVDSSGYSPNSFVLKQNVPVKWSINVKQLTGCNRELVVAEYDIDKQLSKGLNIIEFTPTKTGTIEFTCGMNMLKGSFIVTADGIASQSQIKAATPKSSGSCGCGG